MGSDVSPIHLLVVDDDRSLRFMLQTFLEEQGYKVSTAVNGRVALETMETVPDIAVVLLDREMPEMNGLETVQVLKQHPRLKRLPVIMITGSDKPEQIREGLDAGVFYYLGKPINREVLLSVLSAAVRESQTYASLNTELRRHQKSFAAIDDMTLYVRTLDDVEDVCSFLAHCFPDADRVGPGLMELLINAVEHGNAGVTYKEKSRFMAEGTWREEVNNRLNLPENKKKKVTIVFKKDESGCVITITDEGNGFDWLSYLDVDPLRASDSHGRGIAQAKAYSFDSLSYNKKGNEVMGVVYHKMSRA